jgi:hypothetical protein
MTSTRTAWMAAVCLGAALVPTVLHRYADVRADDGRTTTAIAPRLGGLTAQPTDRRAAWVKKTFDSDDWMERRYVNRQGGDVVLFAARSYDLKRLYHHPELAVAYGNDLREAGTTRLAAMEEVPVHVLRGEAPNPGLAIYALMYEDGFVDNPYLFQMRTAWELLFSPRRAMTLLFAHDPTAEPGMALDTAPATQVLLDAIRSFRAQLRSTAG